MSDEKFYLRIVVENEDGDTLLGDQARYDTYDEAEEAWLVLSEGVGGN